ncbi:Phospholipase D1, partial [Serendipita sp. 411]
LLKRKAQEGVMVYVIVYKEVSNRTTPTDSNYTKQLLTHLHPNIMVQRSPSHFATGTFYWAHHEKMCVIDETIAFMGGLDACYGRWDTPQHVLIDNGEPEGAEGSQIWIGKDYSNPRIMDFHDLNKPEQDMYDRSKVARMPWHDVSLQVVGQPARDLCRHFVQRWNFLLRVKNHSRRMPFLLPPAEFKPGELTSQGLTGTCEMQICRSAGPWSMGTLNRIEKSIQTAYLKAIQMSEHFVYIENQFFITSTVVGDIEIENAIGDALVNRIIKAYRDKTKWRACILLPLLPGFTFPVDHDSASAIRIILECQNRTISRGPHSIFTRLRKEGIDPDDYISFFSLRGWGKLPGDVLTTEQVYIHAKLMIVDDRLAIIGSANINERSMRGDRDSELAAIIRDTDLIEGTMAGKPFKVGRFAHTLRVRLMREHLGVDVDSLYEEDIEQQPDSTDPPQNPDNIQKWDPDNEQEEISPEHPKLEKESFKPIKGETSAATRLMSLAAMNIKQVFSGADAALAYGQGEMAREIGVAPGRGHAKGGDDALEEERQQYGRDGQKEPGFASSKVPTLEEKTVMEKRPKETSGDKPLAEALEKGGVGDEPSEAQTKEGELYGAPADAMPGDHEPPHARTPSKEDADEQERGAVRARTLLRKHMNVPLGTKNWTIPTPSPIIDPHGFEDPVSDKFFKDIWIAAAVHNTETYRQVFHAVPDDMVTTWKQYREFIAHHERLQKPAKDHTQTQTQTSSSPDKPPVGRVPSEGGNSDIGVIVTDTDTDMGAGAAQGKVRKEEHSTTTEGGSNLREPKGSETNASTRTSSPHPGASGSGNGEERPGSPMASHQRLESQSYANPSQATQANQANQAKKKPAGGGGGGGAGEEPFEPWEREFMEELLNDVRGHLGSCVVFFFAK